MNVTPDKSLILEQTIERVRNRVGARGWDLVTVSGGGGVIPFCYTVGFQATWGHPDIIVFGVLESFATAALTQVASRLRGKDWGLPDGTLPKFFGKRDGWACFVRADAYAHYFYVGQRLYPQHTHGIQVFAPDSYGNMPWDRAYNGITPPVLTVLH